MQTNDQIEYSYEDETCEWTELLDRGGLLHVTSEAYHIFEEIEIKTKSFLKQAGMKQNDPIQGKIISSIMEDSNIMKQWVSTTSDMNNDLLFEIGQLFVVLRLPRTGMTRLSKINFKNMEPEKLLSNTVQPLWLYIHCKMCCTMHGICIKI